MAALNPKLLLDAHGLAPKKSLGQNFLHDPNALDKIVGTAALRPGDLALEVGPGTGALTRVLAAQPEVRVVAVELDQRLRPILEASVGGLPNVQLVFGDFLGQDVDALTSGAPWQLVANVPYYITSAIVRHVFEARHKPHRVVMTIQRELAERITAPVGHLSLLAVSVQFYGTPRLVTRLGAGAFWPRPDVESAVLRIDTHPTPLVAVPDEATFFRVVRAGFSQKRKQLKNALASGLAVPTDAAVALLNTADVLPSRRAETLTLAEWGALADAYAAARSSQAL